MASSGLAWIICSLRSAAEQSYFCVQVCLAAERCGHLDFDVREDCWLAPNKPHCTPLATPPGGLPGLTQIQTPRTAVTYAGLLAKVAASAMIWGAGTAIGEVPPYLFAYAAAAQQSAQRHGQVPMQRTLFAEDSGYGSSSSSGGSSQKAGSSATRIAQPQSRKLATRIADASERFLMHAVQRYGFWAVLALASWPNALFDFCGLACGQFQMPFWSFFAATLIGKGFIKVVLQAAAALALFSQGTRQRILTWLEGVAPQKLPLVDIGAPPGVALRRFVERGIQRFQVLIV